MPTQSLLPFVDCPDGFAQELLISNGATVPGPTCSMTPHDACPDRTAFPSEGGASLSCMFCDQIFARQEDLGPHVLTQHPTTFSEPAVLKVDAEFRITGDGSRPNPSVPTADKDEVHSCIVCGQVWQDAGELESHMRKHKEYFTYCCAVCGRRFRESWFLKNHMKIHIKAGGRRSGQQELEPPATVNDVPQEPPSEPLATPYRMCMVCGFFFPDHDALAEHSKVHNREAEPERKSGMDDGTDSQESLLSGLNLHPTEKGLNARRSRRIPELNPFVTYQAWQLATKGKVAVGPNTLKDAGQDASSDNEDSGSDKDESSAFLSEGPVEQRKAAVPKPMAGPPRRSLIQKDKERPTSCAVCQRTFRTYHQLVLHSRVHKREKMGEGSAFSPAETKPTRSPEQVEDGAEEGLEEPLGLGDDGFDRSKPRSRECTYCGKTFRSSYYLTIHLRTHTGEKPYKCVYCDYAAAQKTSLKYHLDRRHKGQPLVTPSRPSAPSPTELKPASDEENPSPGATKLWIPAAGWCSNRSPEDGSSGESSRFGKPLVQVKMEYEEAGTPDPAPLANCPVELKKEKVEMKSESFEAPLNLSVKVSLSFSVGAKSAVVLLSCSLCAFTSVYPEVLIIHRRLIHKDKADGGTKTRFGCNVKLRRFTGCPPALDGKDVPPLLTERRHPRRTKSPPPPQAKPQEKPVNPPQVLRPAPPPPAPTPVRSVAQESQRSRQNAESTTGQDSSRYSELVRKPNPSGTYVLDRMGHLERVGVGERGFPARSSAIWHPDAARLCLSTPFSALPHMDFGEHSNKKMRLAGDAHVGEASGYRGPPVDGSNRLPVADRGLKPQGPRLVTPPESLGGVKTAHPPLGASLDSEWGMMNLLRSCAPGNLAALYHGTPPNTAYGALAPPRGGGRTVLYQHLPTLPRREPAGPLPGQRYGAADKSA